MAGGVPSGVPSVPSGVPSAVAGIPLMPSSAPHEILAVFSSVLIHLSYHILTHTSCVHSRSTMSLFLSYNAYADLALIYLSKHYLSPSRVSKPFYT